MENENKEQELTEVTEEDEVTETEEIEVTEEVEESEETEESEEVVEDPRPKKKFPAWKLAVSITSMVVIICLLTGAVLFGMGYRWEDFFPKPRENDVFYKDNYTVSDDAVKGAADRVIATLGDQSLTNSDMQLYYWLCVQGFSNSAQLEDSNLYLDEPFHEQICNLITSVEMTWQQYFVDTALENWSYFATLNNMAANDPDYEPDQELMAYLDTVEEALAQDAQNNGYADALEMVQAQFGTGTTVEAAAKYLREYLSAMAYYQDLVGRLTPDDAQLEAYYEAHAQELEARGVGKSAGSTVDVRHILLMPENGTLNEDGRTYTYSEEEWEKCRQKAQALYDDWLAGEATEGTFAAFAQKNSVDGSAANGGLYEAVPKGYMVEEFENWIFDEARQPGDHGLVKTVFGYHIMYYVQDHVIWKENAMSACLSEAMDSAIETAVEKWPVEITYKNIGLYDFDFTPETEQ